MSETLYRKNSKGRYIPVAEMELYSNKYYHYGIYLLFAREGLLSTIRLKESEYDTIDILTECVKKTSVEFLSKIISEAHEKVSKKDKNGAYYIPSDWYEEIARMLLEFAKEKE